MPLRRAPPAGLARKKSEAEAPAGKWRPHRDSHPPAPVESGSPIPPPAARRRPAAALEAHPKADPAARYSPRKNTCRHLSSRLRKVLARVAPARSEEHTSELQSLRH